MMVAGRREGWKLEGLLVGDVGTVSIVVGGATCEVTGGVASVMRDR